MAPRFGYGGPFTFCAPGSPWHLRAFAEVNSRRQNDVPAWEVLQYGEDLNQTKTREPNRRATDSRNCSRFMGFGR